MEILKYYDEELNLIKYFVDNTMKIEKIDFYSSVSSKIRDSLQKDLCVHYAKGKIYLINYIIKK